MGASSVVLVVTLAVLLLDGSDASSSGSGTGSGSLSSWITSGGSRASVESGESVTGPLRHIPARPGPAYASSGDSGSVSSGPRPKDKKSYKSSDTSSTATSGHSFIRKLKGKGKKKQ